MNLKWIAKKSRQVGLFKRFMIEKMNSRAQTQLMHVRILTNKQIEWEWNGNISSKQNGERN